MTVIDVEAVEVSGDGSQKRTQKRAHARARTQGVAARAASLLRVGEDLQEICRCLEDLLTGWCGAVTIEGGQLKPESVEIHVSGVDFETWQTLGNNEQLRQVVNTTVGIRVWFVWYTESDRATLILSEQRPADVG